MAIIDYKEKYEKAVQAAMLAKQDTESAVTIGILEEIFPELRESEDERISKEIISAIKEDWPGHTDWIAWLEKQGEQKPADRVEPKDYNSIDPHFGKPIDKIEPKFNVGDWVIDNKNRIGVVKRILKEHYIISFDGREEQVPFVWESRFRKWDISVAKDGDVLACPNDAGDRDVVFIFKNINSDEGWVFCFCASDANGCFCTNNDYVGNSNSTNISPATKEQRDLLFKKMHEAGYEWDAEHKQLRKIEQKPSWSEEDECTLNGILDDYKSMCKTYRNWLESLKNRIQPKQEWKQENTGDLTEFENAMMHIGDSFFGENAGLDPNDTNAIKKQANILLGLVSSKEWSEEDERCLNNAIDACKQMSDEDYDSSQSYIDAINWLNFLRLQNRWKPSKSLIEKLEDIYLGNTNNNHPALHRLIKDLKALIAE